MLGIVLIPEGPERYPFAGCRIQYIVFFVFTGRDTYVARGYAVVLCALKYNIRVRILINVFHYSKPIYNDRDIVRRMAKKAKGSDSESDYESNTRVPTKAEPTKKERVKKEKVKREKRPLNSWAQALQEWNMERMKANPEDKCPYIIPKKGSADYDAVKALMSKS